MTLLRGLCSATSLTALRAVLGDFSRFLDLLIGILWRETKIAIVLHDKHGLNCNSCHEMFLHLEMVPYYFHILPGRLSFREPLLSS